MFKAETIWQEGSNSGWRICSDVSSTLAAFHSVKSISKVQCKWTESALFNMCESAIVIGLKNKGIAVVFETGFSVVVWGLGGT